MTFHFFKQAAFFRPLFLLFVFLLICPQGAKSKNTINQDSISFFYKVPDLKKIPEIIKYLETRGAMKNEDARLNIMGFLAGLFIKHPDQVETFIEGQHSKGTQYVIAASLAFSGMNSRAIEFAKRYGWPKPFQSTLGELRNLELMEVTQASTQDLMWGASFATGSKKYPNKVINALANGIKTGSFELRDILRSSVFSKLEKKNGRKALLKKYGERKFIELTLMGAALWSVASNAGQHEFVFQTVTERINQDPESDLAYLLKRKLFQNNFNIIAEKTGENVGIILSATTDKNIVEAIHKENSGTNFMNSFIHHFDKLDPVYLVNLIFRHKGTGGQYFFEITAPNGSLLTMGPYSINNEEGIYASAERIDEKFMNQEGMYKIEAKIDDGMEKNLIVPFRIFVGQR
jgi:hypothetical protein